MTTTGRVDYEDGARAYQRARTLPTAALDRWSAAVEPQAAAIAGLGHRLRAVDVGAGTGQFVEPLSQWFDVEVVAVEPSPAMRAEGLDMLPRRACYVAAVAERLPFASHRFDVAWLSTVLHQIDDPDLAARELRRVLRTGGRVLVRGLFADVPVTGFLARFPGVDRAARRFPSTDEAVQRFAGAGFVDPVVVDVVEPWPFELDTWVARVRELRHVDSALRPLSDVEVEAGIAAVVDEFGGHDGMVVSETTLRLLVLRG